MQSYISGRVAYSPLYLVNDTVYSRKHAILEIVSKGLQEGERDAYAGGTDGQRTAMRAWHGPQQRAWRSSSRRSDAQALTYQVTVLAPIGLSFDHVVAGVDDWQRAPSARPRGTAWLVGCHRMRTRTVRDAFCARRATVMVSKISYILVVTVSNGPRRHRLAVHQL